MAVGHYHSATPKFHNAYKQRVLSGWMKLCGSNKKDGPRLEQTVMQFDDISDVDDVPKITRKSTPKDIRPFAKVKKVYYSLNGKESSHSISNEKTSYALDNVSSRQYYSLD